MFNPSVWVCAVALAIVPSLARAQSASQLDEIRQQIKALKEAYESRMQALEKRLQAAENAAQAAQAASDAQSAQAAAAAAASPAVPPGTGSSQNAFNPAISLILDGRLANFSQDPKRRSMTGFLSNANTTDALGPRGFSIGESEVTMSANVDHLFFGQATIAVGPDNKSVDVEEAFAQTTALGHGLTIKGGRFLSAIGYNNSMHP